MTPRVIAAGLNRRGPGARRLPNDRFRAPECTLTSPPNPSRQTGMIGHAFVRCSIVLPISVVGRSHLRNLG
jgi:hypothetical protein